MASSARSRWSILNHVIVRTDFTIQPNSLRYGDLMLCWGKPTDIVEGRRAGILLLADMRWGSRINAGLTDAHYAGQIDLFLPISYLSFKAEDLDCA